MQMNRKIPSRIQSQQARPTDHMMSWWWKSHPARQWRREKPVPAAIPQKFQPTLTKSLPAVARIRRKSRQARRQRWRWRGNSLPRRAVTQTQQLLGSLLRTSRRFFFQGKLRRLSTNFHHFGTDISYNCFCTLSWPWTRIFGCKKCRGCCFFMLAPPLEWHWRL